MLKKYAIRYFSVLLFFGSVSVFGQNSSTGCAVVQAGDEEIFGDVLMPCGQETLNLTASYTEFPGTEDYEVRQIPYDPPFNFLPEDPENSISVNQDDRWTRVIDFQNFTDDNDDPLPFLFSFYGQSYPSAIVNTNGVISFSVQGYRSSPGNIPGVYAPSTQIPEESPAPWSFSGSIPGNSGDARTFASIFGVLQDTDPRYTGYEIFDPAIHDINDPANENRWSMNYGILGEYPCRRLVVNFYNLGQYSCNLGVGPQTYQMVLHEITNVIEIHVKRRTPCTWQGGVGVIGIQNHDATEATVPPGRNTGNWEAHEEAWRFSPAGNPSSVEFAWYSVEEDENGDEVLTFIDDETDITVTPPYFPYKYVAIATYSHMVDPIEIKRYVNVFRDEVPIDLGPDIETCNDEVVIDAYMEDFPNLNYIWYKKDENGDFVEIPGETESFLVVNREEGRIERYANTYQVGVTNNDDPDCEPVYDEIEVVFRELMDLDPLEPIVVCDPENDGYVVFELNEAYDAIAQNTTQWDDIVISFHPTLVDAQNNRNAVVPVDIAGEDYYLYTNNNPWNDSAWARVESLTIPGEPTPCVSFLEVPLKVRMSPIMNEPEPMHQCYNEEERWQFNLRSVESNMLGEQDSGNFTFYYFEDEEVAVTQGDNGLVYPDFLYRGYIRTASSYWIEGDDLEIDGDGVMYKPIYVLVVGNDSYTTPHNGGKRCYNIYELKLVIDPLPIATQPTLPYRLCEGNGFDLTSKENEITDNDPDLFMTWFASYEDEENDNPIVDPTDYQNVVNPETVIGRVTSITTECKTLITLTLIAVPAPVATEPSPLELCDNEEENGILEFDLTEKKAEIMSRDPRDPNDPGDPDDPAPVFEVQFFLTRPAAEAGVPGTEITGGLYTNTRSPYSDTVWARMEVINDNSLGACFSIVKVPLKVNKLPKQPIEGFGDLMNCEADSGPTRFDLTENTPFIIGDQEPDDFTLTYHTSEADAEDDEDPIQNATRFPSEGQTIYYRIENNETECVRIGSFNLIVGEGPEITIPETMELCDDEESGSTTDRVSIFDLRSNTPIITDGDITLTVFYYESLEDQQNHNPIQNTSAYANPTGADGLGITPYTIYISVFDEKDCATKTTMDLKVLPNPVLEEPEPLVVCDEEGGGFAEFVLTDKDEEIKNGDQSLEITYHETLIDAELGRLPLSSPYENIIRNRQTIYVRAEYALPPNESGCYTVVPLDLIVSPKPIVPIDLPELVVCDPDGTGIAEFDLTENAPFIYGDQDQELLKLTYHLTEEEALEGVNRIATPESYRSSDRTIYVRLGFTGGDLCFSTGQFEIRVAPQVEIVEPTPYDICNELGEPNDERASFDLTSKSLEITNRTPGLYVEYYLTEQNAIDGVNRIDPEEDFVNTSNPQTVYARVTDDNTGCFTTTSLLLRVLANPEPVTPEPIEKCAVNLDDRTTFDLTIREAHILNGEDWTLTYFESYEDAVENTGRITNTTDYPNISNPQTIYVRATNKGRANELLCFEIVELELRVLQIPDQTAEISPYMICEINAGDLAEFDLTTKIPEILGELNPEDYEVSFYLSARDAERKENRIRDPQHHLNKDWNGNTVNPQDIYVGVFMPGAECYVGGVQKFRLVVQEGVIATEPAEVFSICDNIQPSDGIAEFDLEDFSNQKVVNLRNEILSGQDPTTYSLHFYTSYEDAEEGEEENRIVWPYINQVNPQVIYARVTNEANRYLPKCHEIVEVILRVEEIPEIIFEEEYRLCIDGEGNPIMEEFGEMSPPVLDTDLSAELYTFEWLYDGVIIIGEEGASIVAETAGEYMVIATHIESGCTTEGSTTVVVSSPPTYFDAEVTSDAFSEFHVIEITATGDGEYEFNINGGPFQDDPVFTDVPEGNHTIVIRDKFGCGSVSIVVGAIDYPKFFTPNNDGYNDTWNIVGMSYIDPEAKIYVFDKFGKLLAQLTPHSEGWDGTYRGRDLPSSDYWFRVEYTEDGDRKEMKGHFTLKR